MWRKTMTKPQPSYAQPAGMAPAQPKPQPQGQALNATMQPARPKAVQPGIGAQPAPAAAANQAAMAAERGAPAAAPAAQRLAVTKAQPPAANAGGNAEAQMQANDAMRSAQAPLSRDPMAAANQFARGRGLDGGMQAPAANANQASMQAAQQGALAPAANVYGNAEREEQMQANDAMRSAAPTQQLGGLAQAPSAAALENLRRMQAARLGG